MHYLTTSPRSGPQDAVPTYQQIKQELLEQILTAKLRPGDQIPPELELADRYQVNRWTANKAVAQLVQEGYLVRHRGKGTFVKDRNPAVSGPPIAVISLNPTYASPFINPYNWFTDWYVMQGIIEASKEVGIPLRFVDGKAAQDQLPAALRGITDVILLDPAEHLAPPLTAAGCRVAMAYVPLPDHSRCSNVTTDWHQASQAATDHLFSLGHRKIAVLHGSASIDRKTAMRVEGIIASLQEHGIFEPALVKTCETTRADVEEVLAPLLTDSSRPTGLIATNDLRAVHAIDIARRQGLEMPRDLAVVGFGDSPHAATCSPPLSSSRAPYFECGFQTVKLLARQRAANTFEPEQIVLPCELIVRESSRGARS